MSESSAVKALFNEIQGDILPLPYLEQLLDFGAVSLYTFDNNLLDTGINGNHLTGNETYVDSLVPALPSGKSARFDGFEQAVGSAGVDPGSFADTTIVWTQKASVSQSGDGQVFDTNWTDYDVAAERDYGLRANLSGRNLNITFGGGTFNSSNITTTGFWNDIIDNTTDTVHLVLVLNERISDNPSNSQFDNEVTLYVNGVQKPVSTYSQSSQWDQPRGSFGGGAGIAKFGYYEESAADSNMIIDTWAALPVALTQEQVLALYEAHGAL